VCVWGGWWLLKATSWQIGDEFAHRDLGLGAVQVLDTKGEGQGLSCRNEMQQRGRIMTDIDTKTNSKLCIVLIIIIRHVTG
jgi:hypothetical protein